MLIRGPVYLNLSARLNSHDTVALFAYLIIRIFQLVFSVGTVFFSHNKSANSTFSHGFSAKRMGSVSFSHNKSALTALSAAETTSRTT
jgi:hypothetical protein